MVVADAAQHGGLEAEPCGAKGDIGGGTAQVLGEACNVLKPCAHLLGVKVDAQAPEANQIQLTPTGKTSLAHAGSCYFYQPALCRRGDGKRSWCKQTRTSSGANQYLFHIFFRWNIFSIKLAQDHSSPTASFQQAPPLVMPRYFFAPTL